MRFIRQADAQTITTEKNLESSTDQLLKSYGTAPKFRGLCSAAQWATRAQAVDFVYGFLLYAFMLRLSYL